MVYLIVEAEELFWSLCLPEHRKLVQQAVLHTTAHQSQPRNIQQELKSPQHFQGI